MSKKHKNKQNSIPQEVRKPTEEVRNNNQPDQAPVQPDTQETFKEPFQVRHMRASKKLSEFISELVITEGITVTPAIIETFMETRLTRPGLFLMMPSTQQDLDDAIRITTQKEEAGEDAPVAEAQEPATPEPMPQVPESVGPQRPHGEKRNKSKFRKAPRLAQAFGS